MTRKEKISKLKKWKASHDKVQTQFTKLFDLVGGDFDSPFAKPIWEVWDDYTDTLSELLGDKYQWLVYYTCDCDMGKDPKEVILNVGGKEEKLQLDCIEALLYIIEKDNDK